MQSNEPMIHTMYERLSTLVFSLMKKFINKKAITTEGGIKAKHGSNLASVDISANQLKLEKIDIGTRAKTIIMSFDINSEHKKGFLQMIDFFISSTKYEALPISVAKQPFRFARIGLNAANSNKVTETIL